MSNCVESCKKFVMRIVRCLTVLRAVRSLYRRIVRCLTVLRAVRSVLGEL